MQTATYIVRQSQDNPSLYECFNTETQQVSVVTERQHHADRLCREYNHRAEQRRVEEEKRRMVEDNVIAALKAGGEEVEIKTGKNLYGHAWRTIQVFEPTSAGYVSLSINKMDVRGWVYRISVGNVKREHTRSNEYQMVNAQKVLALVASGKAAKAAAHRREQAYYASRNSVQQVVEAADSLLDKWGDGCLQNLGMMVSVGTERGGTGVTVTLKGHMTAERAAAVLAALRDLKV